MVALFQINRLPQGFWGKVAMTFESVTITNPTIDLGCHLIADGKERRYMVHATDVDIPNQRVTNNEAKRFAGAIQRGMAELGIGGGALEPEVRK